jgi:ribonuclease HI
MSKRTERILAEISELSEQERAELKAALARSPHWGHEGMDLRTTRADFVLVFDGGSRGNPGAGYGSFLLVRQQDGDKRLKRLQFDDRMTSNEAEYDTLIAALEELLAWAVSSGFDPGQVSVEVRGDSQLVLRQVGGQWRARDSRMIKKRDETLTLLRQLGSYRLAEQPRTESVRLLGH